MLWQRKTETKVLKEEKKEENTLINKKDADLARQTLQELLNAMELITSVAIKDMDKERSRVELDVSGDDLGRVIGHNGKHIDALQSLITAMVSNILKKRVSVIIDANFYRQKRQDKIVQDAILLIKKVQETGVKQILEPMNSYDRRKIHELVSEKYADLKTESEGMASERRVVIEKK